MEPKPKRKATQRKPVEHIMHHLPPDHPQSLHNLANKQMFVEPAGVLGRAMADNDFDNEQLFIRVLLDEIAHASLAPREGVLAKKFGASGGGIRVAWSDGTEEIVTVARMKEAMAMAKNDHGASTASGEAPKATKRRPKPSCEIARGASHSGNAPAKAVDARIQAVALAGPTSLTVTWADGATSLRELGPWIDSGGPLLAPLKDPKTFAKAAVADFGTMVTWDDGVGDLAIDAFHLRLA